MFYKLQHSENQLVNPAVCVYSNFILRFVLVCLNAIRVLRFVVGYGQVKTIKRTRNYHDLKYKLQ